LPGINLFSSTLLFSSDIIQLSHDSPNSLLKKRG
jgi:hypothetical protein